MRREQADLLMLKIHLTEIDYNYGISLGIVWQTDATMRHQNVRAGNGRGRPEALAHVMFRADSSWLYLHMYIYKYIYNICVPVCSCATAFQGYRIVVATDTVINGGNANANAEIVNFT